MYCLVSTLQQIFESDVNSSTSEIGMGVFHVCVLQEFLTHELNSEWNLYIKQPCNKTIINHLETCFFAKQFKKPSYSFMFYYYTISISWGLYILKFETRALNHIIINGIQGLQKYM